MMITGVDFCSSLIAVLFSNEERVGFNDRPPVLDWLVYWLPGTGICRVVGWMWMQGGLRGVNEVRKSQGGAGR